MSKDLSPVLEDYLENIYLLQKKNDVVRVKDLACALDIKASSVNEALGSLKIKGYVLHEKYGAIDLTAKGKKLAAKIYKRHQDITAFLHNVLGVPPKQAEEDACKIEHHLSAETVKRMVLYAKN